MQQVLVSRAQLSILMIHDHAIQIFLVLLIVRCLHGEVGDHVVQTVRLMAPLFQLKLKREPLSHLQMVELHARILQGQEIVMTSCAPARLEHGLTGAHAVQLVKLLVYLPQHRQQHEISPLLQVKGSSVLRLHELKIVIRVSHAELIVWCLHGLTGAHVVQLVKLLVPLLLLKLQPGMLSLHQMVVLNALIFHELRFVLTFHAQLIVWFLIGQNGVLVLQLVQ
jgi:hypothetical protein